MENFMFYMYNKYVKNKGRATMRKAKYDSINFAKMVINLCCDYNIFLNNLQLQKILYYLQGEYLKKYNIKAFSDPIECWTYGPVVAKVWKYFSVFGSGPIYMQDKVGEFSDDEKKTIIDICIEKSNMDVWKLVDNTHNELPWKNAYEHHNNYISDEDMKEFFCN